MADHTKVLVYIPAPDARRLRAQGITDIPTWVRQRVKDAVSDNRLFPEPPEREESE